MTPEREQDSLLLRVNWQTEYRYEQPARASHNELRVLPQTFSGQEILREDLRTHDGCRAMLARAHGGVKLIHFGGLKLIHPMVQ